MVEHRIVVARDDQPAPIVVPKSKEVAGHHFVPLAKAERFTAKILLPEQSSKERLLCKSNVFEQVKGLRNRKVDALLAGPEAAEDLGLDDETPTPAIKRMRKSKESLPPFLTLEVPEVAGVPGVSMKVLPHNGITALWVELTSTTLEFLAAAIKAQLDNKVASADSETPPIAASSGSGPAKTDEAGITWDASRNAYRVRRADGRLQYFRAKSHAEALGVAREWNQSLPGDDDLHEPVSQPNDDA